jgi:hypothetical protein
LFLKLQGAPADPKIITEAKPADPLKPHAQTERKSEA